ncbi:Putrescine importer PuuP [Leucobacter sp. OLJS4]|uniref:APC family permease n=1 Tax=unclassified Leucobacter TaxID=2621730 RepID=UPI000C174AC8|nr:MULTISPECIES: APC family permease [unclassified Leucobacter]PIJ55455.1 Putrescine importer PuuP [Leucobacter sp. OLES1]PII85322.1 Putrescine importer PuuP [Leucobacter sp. OLCALW19]PII93102.1 Putrescine importer PuuP [Leucobacter sp. OLAS13]PII95974.1 Putrescine importer PuuP [Leucobacter sp. OLTLW20]PII99226.1 Putrescine importer PuuP [Leucobacter sp. OLDS2]
MTTTSTAAKGATLKRSLGLWAIVGLGLGYMTPTVVFDTFGLVARDTNNVVPLAYAVALIVMVFTAISYGKIAGAIPSAGSAYTYVRESMHPNLGFMVGWTSLIDYMLLPMVNCLIIRSYLEAFFPGVPGWIWVIVYVVFVTGIIYLTMRGTSNINMILLVFSIVVMAVFVFMVVIQLNGGAGEGGVVSMKPLFHNGVEFGAVLAGATIVCFSFIGFDAVTMYAEEAKHPRIMPKAILLTVILGGAIFFIAGYFTQMRFPDWNEFAPKGDMQFVEDSTLPIIGEIVGGKTLSAVLTAAGFAATLASGLASHASVSRMLLVMGRNNVLPKKFFGYINAKTHTPTFNIVLTGAISLLAAAFTLEMIAAFINYGALIAFTFVNLSVIAWFAFRKGLRKTPKDIFNYIVMPLIGTLLTGLLWVNLHADALVGGLIWTAIGFVYLLFITKGFRRKVAAFDENQPVTGFNKVPEGADVD